MYLHASFHRSGVNGLCMFCTGQWTRIAGTTLVWTVVILNSSETSGQKGVWANPLEPLLPTGLCIEAALSWLPPAQLQEVQHSVVQCWLLNTVLLTSWYTAYSLNADFTAVKLNYVKRGLTCKLEVDPWFFFLVHGHRQCLSLEAWTKGWKVCFWGVSRH